MSSAASAAHSDSAKSVAPRRIRLAYVVSHPIQYQAGLLRRIAADPAIDLLVLFCSDFSMRAYRDAGFGVAVTWAVPLTEGYRSVVLSRWRDTSSPGPFAPISRGFLRALRHGIDGAPFDAVWIHGYSTTNALHALLAARLLGLPVLLRAEPWLGDRRRSPRKLWAKRLFFKTLRSAVTAVLPIGTRNAAYWAHCFGRDFPAFLMPYAVDNDFFDEGIEAAAAGRADLQRELNLDPQRPVVLFASKLQHRKHCDHLLEAFLQIATAPAPYLLIVGDGEQMSALQGRVAASGNTDVRFAGFRNQRELPRFFDLGSVFVLPSQHEAWGLIVNEAMAAGLPVVVSEDVGCAVDLVCGGENGMTYPFGDVAALRDCLLAVLEPGRAQAMGDSSRKRIAQWSYTEDLAGLKAALQYAIRLPLDITSEVPVGNASEVPHAAASR